MRRRLATIGSFAATLFFTAAVWADPPISPAATTIEDAAPWLDWEKWPVQPLGLYRRQAHSSAYGLLIQQNEGEIFALRDDAPEDDGEVDISKPGLDMGDYPNSAYTLRKGRAQLEMAPASFRTQNANNASAHAWPYLFRYGVTDDVEFRVLGAGLTTLINPQQMTGFSPITFDTKIHLWNDRMECFIPAVSFEASLQTQTGSPFLQAGTEPWLNINMDFPFTKTTNLEMTLGYSGQQTDINLVTRNTGGSALESQTVNVQVPGNIYVAYLQWALEQQVTDKFEVFVHGYFARPLGTTNDVSVVMGAGFFYQISKRTMIFGSANAGLTDVPSPFLTQLGLAFAF